jgi:hypothetical protein
MQCVVLLFHYGVMLIYNFLHGVTLGHIYVKVYFRVEKLNESHLNMLKCMYSLQVELVWLTMDCFEFDLSCSQTTLKYNRS